MAPAISFGDRPSASAAACPTADSVHLCDGCWLDSRASFAVLYSEFDTNLLSLTVIPVLGFWKLLPTFGGCVITASSAELNGDSLDARHTRPLSIPASHLACARLLLPCRPAVSHQSAGDACTLRQMEVQYTTSRPVPGLSGLRPLPGEIGRKIAEVRAVAHVESKGASGHCAL